MCIVAKYTSHENGWDYGIVNKIFFGGIRQIALYLRCEKIDNPIGGMKVAVIGYGNVGMAVFNHLLRMPVMKKEQGNGNNKNITTIKSNVKILYFLKSRKLHNNIESF